MTITQNTNGTKSDKFKVIGTNPIRHDGVDKVTGRAAYGADTQLPGMLFGKVLRSPHAHAWIKSINTDKAEALDGVKAVVTAADFPDAGDRRAVLGEAGEVPLKPMVENVMASKKVLYHGHAVASVAATNPHIAEEALKLIEVDYEVLPPVMDVLKAMEPDSPLLDENLYTDEGLGKMSDNPSNIASCSKHEQGNLKQGFDAADHILEREYRCATVHQGYLSLIHI